MKGAPGVELESFVWYKHHSMFGVMLILKENGRGFFWGRGEIFLLGIKIEFAFQKDDSRSRRREMK